MNQPLVPSTLLAPVTNIRAYKATTTKIHMTYELLFQNSSHEVRHAKINKIICKKSNLKVNKVISVFVCNTGTTIIVRSVGKVAFLPLFFPSSPRPWPNV